MTKLQARPSEDLLCLILDAFVVRIGTAKPQELANCLWSLASLGFRPPAPWLDAYFAACEATLHGWNTRDLSQACYSLARLRLRPPVYLMRGVLEEAAASLPAWRNSQDLCHMAWGLAQMGVAPGQPWCELALAALARMADGAPAQHLATTMWGLAKLGLKVGGSWAPSPLGDGSGGSFGGGSSVERGMPHGSGSSGVVERGMPHGRGSSVERAVSHVESAAFRRLLSMQPREMAALLWGFSSSGYSPDPDWLEAYVVQCSQVGGRG